MMDIRLRWQRPLAKSSSAAGMVHEVLTEYGPVNRFWFDVLRVHLHFGF